MSGRGASGLSGDQCGSDDIVEQLREAADDREVGAVVIRLNTPGGSAAGSQEISREIEHLRESGKKVVASMGDVCASGGYWIAAGADAIVANPATITGSIGVIMEVTRLEQLMKKIGVEIDTVKSGPYKDIGSMSRKLEDEERAILQGMVDDIYAQFLDTVAAGRKMDMEKVRSLADGRIFTGRQARELGLVDEFGNVEDALVTAAEAAGIEDDWTLKEFGKVSPLERLLDLLEGRVALGSLLGAPALGRELTGLPGLQSLPMKLWFARDLLRSGGLR
ncbi:MAG: signal peptide peptidase SppA [Firmicutes bacterium]|nr:signal peptide peptidase SppA [Bacillota bacterium]